MMLDKVIQGPSLKPEISKGPRVLGKPNEDETPAVSAGVQGRVLQLVELPGRTLNPMTSVLKSRERKIKHTEKAM